MGMDPQKLHYWSAHYQGWQASGLTRRAYCEREGLSLPSYERWSKRVRASAKEPTSFPKLTTAPTQPLTLVPVQVMGQHNNESLTLRSPAGWEMRLPTAVDPAWLAAVLKQL